VPHVRIWPGGDGQPSSLPGPLNLEGLAKEIGVRALSQGRGRANVTETANPDLHSEEIQLSGFSRKGLRNGQPNARLSTSTTACLRSIQ
jgi:hypothetical protein